MARDNSIYSTGAMSLGRRVEALMSEQGISQAELGRRVGLTQPAIFALIRRNKTGTKSLHQIARALGTSAAYLNGETDDPHADQPDEAPLSSEEAELLDLFRGMEPKERSAILTLARSIATNARSPTVHDRGQAYKGAHQ